MEQLLNIMRELREKCPWDKQQTPQSLTRYAIEEAYEVEAAVRSGSAEEVRDELGDLLLQVVFQAQMYSEQGAFNFQDVVQAICAKLIRRHPHVFQAEQFSQLTPEDVADFHAIADRGVAVEYQVLPSHPVKNLIEMLDNAAN